MSISVLLWFGIDFLIKCIMALFFAFIGGLGLAAGFDIYKRFIVQRDKNKNDKYKQKLRKEYIGIGLEMP